jgi:hypothetical protein
MSEAKRDGNYVPTLLGVSSVDDVTPVPIYADPTTHRLLVDLPSGTGDVVGPASATDNAIVRFDGATGTLIQNSVVIIDDTTGAITGTQSVTIGVTGSATGTLLLKGTTSGTVTIQTAAAAGTYTLTLPTDDGTPNQLLQTNGSGVLTWATVSGTGDVVGPASSTDNAVARFDGATGKLLQNSTVIIGDTGAIATTIADTSNVIGLTVTQSDSTNNPLAISVVNAGTNYGLQIETTNAGSYGSGINLFHNTASPANLDVVSEIISTGKDSGAATQTWTRQRAIITDVTAASEDAKITWGVVTAGTVADELELTGAALYPTTSDGLALGASANQFSDLFLASGGVINFDNGDMTITDGVNTLAFAGGPVSFDSNITPAANDGSALGTTALQWSDLFLAEGAVINFDNGDVTVTQTNNVLAVSGGDLQVATAGVGTNADSVPTLSSTSTFTNKTLTSPTITTANLSGTQLLAEGASIGLDPSASADGAYSGITVTGTSGYAQAFGDLVYLDPTDSRWEAADANAASGADGDSRGLLGMVVVTGTDGNTCTILLQGVIRADANFPTFTVNNPIYVSETAGDVTQTQPTTTDVVIRIVGAALTADSMYFNPDFTWITHT